MSFDISQLIHGYLDDSLTPEEQTLLSEWIKSDASHARTFATEVMLHDRLRNISIGEQGNESAFLNDSDAQVQPVAASASTRRVRSFLSWVTAICLLLFGGLFSWHYVGMNSVSAAAVELDRLIAVSSQRIDHTFTIAVEEIALSNSRRDSISPESHRPPKPSLDGAILHVRGPQQFVLQRKIEANQFFVTGSNGKTSWAVRPDGPVRVSADLTRFNHDVPGHEHSMPLSNLHDGLEQLHVAYDVELMPVEPPEDVAVPNAEPSRLMVAVKKRGFRGPKRVEITYGATSGQIRQLRFVEMPYGPERLTVRMTLVDEHNLADSFFDHESHHDSMRVVEFEE